MRAGPQAPTKEPCDVDGTRDDLFPSHQNTV
jgi:hypothetical protein